MKKFKYILSLVLIISLFFSSCELGGSIDDIKPNYKLTEETTFTDAAKVEASLNGVYNGWKGFGIGLAGGLSHQMSGIYLSQAIAPAWVDLSFEPNTVYIDNLYKDYYIIIQRANFLIKNVELQTEGVPGLTEERKNEILAEAKIHRAVAHFFALMRFGQFWDLNSDLGIVTNTEPILSTEDNPRSTVQETYDLILADLDFAIANAPATMKASGYLSQGSAKGFKAKVKLFMADYADAASLALEVINSGEFTLESNFADIFQNGYESSEMLFSPISIGYNGASNPGPYFSNPQQIFLDIADGVVGAPDDGDNITGEGFDPRFAYAHAVNNIPPGINHNKYPQPSSADGKANSHYFLRISELYLIYAEAKARTTSGVDADALAKLNAIRLRAGLTDPLAPVTNAELLEMIRIEKILELFGEQTQPWFDMIRYHEEGDIDIKSIKPAVTSSDKYILPIPEAAMAGNGGLVQNPGYAGN